MITGIELKGTPELARALAEVKGDAHRAIGAALYQEAEAIMTDSKRIVDVDQGTLRNAGFVNPPETYVHETTSGGSGIMVEMGYGGAAIGYACVRGRTGIHVEHGTKRADEVVVGDRVLTQAGVWKPVKRVFRYTRSEPTPMVRITAAWRSDSEASTRAHTLEITPQHEVMVYRDGKNQWVEAGAVLVGDRMFRRRKAAHNAGKGKVEERGPCPECGKTWTYHLGVGQGQKFCSVICRAHSQGREMKGKPRPAYVRAKMSATMSLRHMFMPEKHPNRVVAGRGKNTDIALKVGAFLRELGIPYEVNASVGRRHVDFMCPTLKRVIEVDGAYWHRDQAKDVARDKELLAKLGPGWHIVHFHFFDPRFSPELEPEPIPQRSYYVSVNPGPATYVEPTKFEQSEVLSVEHYVWSAYRTGAHLTLIDFEVEGIASYTAGGLVIHNCYLHEGTGPAVGQMPFMPPVAPFKEWAKRVLGDESLGFVIARAVGARGLAPRKFLEKPFKARAATMVPRLARRIRAAMRTA